jgi:hypothetical protein
MWTEGQRKNLSEEGDENSRQFGNSDIVRVGSGVWVLNCGRGGQEVKCVSGTGRVEEEPKEAENKLVSNKGKGRHNATVKWK